MVVPAVATSDANIAAVICVVLTNVVALLEPLNCTLAPFAKLVPLSVRVNAAEPATTVDGDSELTVGAGLLIVNDAALDVPPGGGLVTVTFTVPAVTISAAVIAADNCVALVRVVVLATPLNVTTDVDTKPVPFTVNVNAAPPAVAISEAKIAAVICVVLTNVVALLERLNCTLAPFTKPAPLTVSVNAAEPATAVEGDSELIVGAGLLIVNDAAFDVPPGGGLVTVTFTVPDVTISAAVIAADNCVALVRVVVLATPLNLTTDSPTKPLPFTVSVNAAPPAVALLGESDEIATFGLLIVN